MSWLSELMTQFVGIFCEEKQLLYETTGKPFAINQHLDRICQYSFLFKHVTSLPCQAEKQNKLEFVCPVVYNYGEIKHGWLETPHLDLNIFTNAETTLS